MKTCYINGVSCISNQPTFEGEFLAEVRINDTDTVRFAIEPSYKEFIPPAAIRRMAKGVKMGIAASTVALRDANVSMPDAIITGTGMGCLEDSEKFLKAIIDNQEQFLTPTSFIQSTHNTVGGQIALGLQCKAYNFTYVNGAVSFETALLDAKMQMESEEANTVLIGGIDETSPFTTELFKLVNFIKKDEDMPASVVNPQSGGVVFSEGASFFVLENEKKAQTYASVYAMTMVNTLEEGEVPAYIESFLTFNHLNLSDIDAVVLGNNGDIEFDGYYDFSKTLFSETPQAYYKHLSGEYNTASAFGFWMAAHIVKNQHIPEVVRLNQLEKKNYRTVLLYNQYRGKDHSLIVLKNAQT